MTASSDAERQRRSRAHRRDDHRYCLHEVDQPEQPDVTEVTPVTIVTVEEPSEPAGPGAVSLAVAEALAAAEAPDTDSGAVELARRYAALIDDAAIAAKYAEPLASLRRLVRTKGDPVTERHLLKIETALSAHTVASDLGPKLLATLTALGMTAAGRSSKGGAPDVPAVSSALDELRKRREQRAAR